MKHYLLVLLAVVFSEFAFAQVDTWDQVDVIEEIRLKDIYLRKVDSVRSLRNPFPGDSAANVRFLDSVMNDPSASGEILCNLSFSSTLYQVAGSHDSTIALGQRLKRLALRDSAGRLCVIPSLLKTYYTDFINPTKRLSPYITYELFDSIAYRGSKPVIYGLREVSVQDAEAWAALNQKWQKERIYLHALDSALKFVEMLLDVSPNPQDYALMYQQLLCASGMPYWDKLDTVLEEGQMIPVGYLTYVDPEWPCESRGNYLDGYEAQLSRAIRNLGGTPMYPRTPTVSYRATIISRLEGPMLVRMDLYPNDTIVTIRQFDEKILERTETVFHYSNCSDQIKGGFRDFIPEIVGELERRTTPVELTLPQIGESDLVFLEISTPAQDGYQCFLHNDKERLSYEVWMSFVRSFRY